MSYLMKREQFMISSESRIPHYCEFVWCLIFHYENPCLRLIPLVIIRYYEVSNVLFDRRHEVEMPFGTTWLVLFAFTYLSVENEMSH